MYIKRDLTGQRFGRLVATGRDLEAAALKERARWLCTCDCGGAASVLVSNLVRGNSTSCGCLKAETNTSHGMAGTKVYSVWRQMLQRCENPNDPAFRDYGARGIKVCEQWHRFDHFYADMGNPPHAGTLERGDNDGPYSPENCRWASRREQSINKRSNRVLTAFGRSQTLQEWSEEMKLPLTTLRNRLDRGGWPIERALTEPARPGRKL